MGAGAAALVARASVRFTAVAAATRLLVGGGASAAGAARGLSLVGGGGAGGDRLWHLGMVGAGRVTQRGAGPGRAWLWRRSCR